MLSDGRSFVIRKNTVDLPDGVNLTSGPLQYETFGMGIFQDIFGETWENADHIFNTCDDHRERGMAMMAFVFIALVISFGTSVANILGAQSGKGVFGSVAIITNIFQTICSIVSLSLAASIFDESFSCDIYSTQKDLRLKDIVVVNYAIPFLALGGFFSLVSAVVLYITEANHNSDTVLEDAIMAAGLEEDIKAATLAPSSPACSPKAAVKVKSADTASADSPPPTEEAK